MCLFAIEAGLISVIWLVIPTAEYIYSQTPSAEALDIFAKCTIAGLIYLLAAMILIIVNAAVLVPLIQVSRMLRDTWNRLHDVRR